MHIVNDSPLVSVTWKCNKLRNYYVKSQPDLFHYFNFDSIHSKSFVFQAIQRAERAHEQQLRRISSFMAREVRGFWGNIEKLFEFRLKSQIERKRKIAMDEHLVRRISFFFWTLFVVDRLGVRDIYQSRSRPNWYIVRYHYKYNNNNAYINFFTHYSCLTSQYNFSFMIENETCMENELGQTCSTCLIESFFRILVSRRKTENTNYFLTVKTYSQ